jgi:predicted PurR-regulated permease PerM
MIKKVDISHKTIVFIVVLLIGLWFIYYIRDILFQLLIALVIVASFNPAVSKLESKHVPRVWGVAIAYMIFLGIIGFSIYILAPSLVNQTASLVANIPGYISEIGLPTAFKEQILQQFLLQLGQIPSQLAKTTVSIFSNVVNVVTVFILSFYLLLQKGKLEWGLSIVPNEEKKKKILEVAERIEKRIGMWAKGELLLMFVVGLSTYIGLLLLRVPYALPLAILAGLLEIVPMIGPFIAAIPAVIIGFSTSLFTGIATASLAFLIQQVENYVFVPKIMQKSAGVNPVVTLLALSVGFRLQGTTGAIVAIPVVLALNIIIEYLLSTKDQEQQSHSSQ